MDPNTGHGNDAYKSRGRGSAHEYAFMKEYARSATADTENARNIHEQAP